MGNNAIGIGLIGLGVVGGQVATVLSERAGLLARQAGRALELRKIKVLPADLTRPLAARFPRDLFTTGEDFFDEPGIDIIVETMGGEEPALDYLRRALTSGRHVVTANKEVIAKHGLMLAGLARENGVSLLYEASVGGGIPLVAPFKSDLVANEIGAIYAIINGTTNYILSRMAREDVGFSQALLQAQEKGFAESDPANDVEGVDAAYKLAILASLAFGCPVQPDEVYREGISRLASQDFRYASELGFAIKLLALAKQSDGAIEVRVHPVFIPEDSFLAKVNGVYNAVQIESDLAGKVLFFGQGAGAAPTSSAVVADIVTAARRIDQKAGREKMPLPDSARRIRPMSEITTRFYLRLNIADRPGVLAQIAKLLGDNDISISAAIQKEADTTSQSAEIVLMTHPAREAAMQGALTTLGDLEAVREIGNCIRVEDIE